ncbi:hypothetical protein [Alicyclobacillus acidiphilus]|uniref:hypothetical protein n=1 Tax=Alicyclobacillus acidiphilus TaxID=182455 RepID=UPI00289328E7|nr:hypothetical protein [Alicyclobacillus acidiphilus]
MYNHIVLQSRKGTISLNKQRALALLAGIGTLITIATPVYANTTAGGTTAANQPASATVQQAASPNFGFLPPDPIDEEDE